MLNSTFFIYSASAGDEQDPEILDEEDTDVFEYLDVISAWFFEKEEEPDYLFTAIKLKHISPYHLKQHLTIHWDYNGIPHASGLHIGYGNPWFSYSGGWGHGFWFQEHYVEVEGENDPDTGIAICRIPKSVINNPQKGDVLENTYALTFERFGFIGRLGFGRPLIRSIIYKIALKDVCDYAPESTDYGRDYVIKY